MKLTPELAATTLSARLIGPVLSDAFPNLTLLDLAASIPDQRQRNCDWRLHGVFSSALERDPWTVDEVTQLVVITAEFPPDADVGLDPPTSSRLSPEAIDYLLNLQSTPGDWIRYSLPTTLWLRYALATTIISDAQFTKLLSVVSRLHPRDQRALVHHVRCHVTSFDRLFATLSHEHLSALPHGEWSDRLLTLPRSQGDLLALVPYLRADTAARFLLRGPDAAQPRPTRATLDAYLAVLPDLPPAFARIIIGAAGYRSPRTLANTREFTRLLLHVPGLVAYLRQAGIFAGSESRYIVDTRRLIFRLLKFSTLPQGTLALADNPSATLGQALRTSNILVAA